MRMYFALVLISILLSLIYANKKNHINALSAKTHSY
jgi:hypothetical protein